MKKQILDALKAKFTGVAESILNRIADKLAKTVLKDEEVTTAVEGVTLNQVLESYGDSRATEAQQSAVVNYEKKHGLKDGQKHGGEPTEHEPAIEPTDAPTWVKAILDSNKSLADRLNGLENEKITATRKQQLSKLIEKLPDSIRKPYARMSLEGLSDEDFNATLSEVTSEVESIASELTTKGAVFHRPIGGGSTFDAKPTDKDVDAVVQAMGL